MLFRQYSHEQDSDAEPPPLLSVTDDAVIRIDMSKQQSKIKYFFKAKTADQLEVKELLFTHASSGNYKIDQFNCNFH